jgi:hypothetical protein
MQISGKATVVVSLLVGLLALVIASHMFIVIKTLSTQSNSGAKDRVPETGDFDPNLKEKPNYEEKPSGYNMFSTSTEEYIEDMAASFDKLGAEDVAEKIRNRDSKGMCALLRKKSEKDAEINNDIDKKTLYVQLLFYCRAAYGNNI